MRPPLSGGEFTKLYFCPSCSRVYCLAEGPDYLCGRNHAPAIWPDGRVRRFNISEKEETNKPPWQIPGLVEERELLTQELTESWLGECPNPDDEDYRDVRRHFGYGAPGGRHLTKGQVLEKYGPYVLKPVE